jgi:putative transposase
MNPKYELVQPAIKKRDVNGVLLHSDQRIPVHIPPIPQPTTKIQYYRQYVEERKLRTMRVLKLLWTFKSECMRLHSFRETEEVRKAVDPYIHFCNHERFQKRLNHLTQ